MAAPSGTGLPVYGVAEQVVSTAVPRARYLYLMSKPIPMDVQIGALGKTLHYAYWASEIVFKTALFHAASHQAAPTIGFLMFTLLHSAPYLTAHTMVDVKVRQALKSSWLTRKLSGVAGVERAILMSSGALQFSGPLVSARKSQNYVFLETSQPLKLEGELLESFGEPIDMTNSTNTSVKFKLMIDGEARAVEWEAPLGDVIDQKPIPEDVADAWRTELKAWDAVPRARVEKLLGKHNRQVQVDASVTLPSGETIPLDAMISGGQVRKLLGMSLLQQMKDFFVERILRGELVERAFSLDTKNFGPQNCELLLRGQQN